MTSVAPIRGAPQQLKSDTRDGLEAGVGGRDNCASSVLLIRLIVEALKDWPHGASVICATFRVDRPWTYRFCGPDTRAFWPH